MLPQALMLLPRHLPLHMHVAVLDRLVVVLARVEGVVDAALGRVGVDVQRHVWATATAVLSRG